MKTPSWVEPAAVFAGFMAAMIAVMWVQQPANRCTLPPEAPRVLVLSRETDREHLAADLDAVERIARRDMRSTPDPAQQLTRYTGCRAALLAHIATTHGLSGDTVARHIARP